MADTRTRLSLLLGERAVDVAVPAGTPLYETLQAVGVEIADPSVTVLDSSGRHIDLYGSRGQALVDGSVLHVVRRPGQAPTPTAPTAAAQPVDPVAGRPPLPWWLLLGVVGSAVLILSLALDITRRGGAGLGALDPDLRWALAATTLAAAVAIAVVIRPGRSLPDDGPWATGAAAALGAGAGVLTVDPGAAAAGHLALVAGLGGAGVVTALRWGVLRREGSSWADTAGALLTALAVSGAVCAGTLLAGLPAALAAGALLGLVPLGMRALSSLSLEIPEDQLLDVSVVARTATGVRAEEPRPLGPVHGPRVHRAVRSAERRRDAGAVLLSVLAVVTAPVLLASTPDGAIPRWTSLAAVLAVVMVLVLQPRTTRGSLARWAPRLAAATLLGQLGVLVLAAPDGPVALTGGTTGLALLGVGVLAAALAVPMGRGWRSVGLSRLGDGFEGLAAVLAFPLALAGAGAIEVFRQVTSR